MMGFAKPGLQLGLIGYPVNHSLSPRIHQAALEALGMTGEYRLYSVPPLPEGKPALEELLEGLRQDQIDGLNVTIPHKQVIIPSLDTLTNAARAIGAVNTLYVEGEQLIGDNTDAVGFWADLQPRLEKWEGEQQALLLGAGGSARAVAYALLREGWRLTLAARRPDQSLGLVKSFQWLIDDFSTSMRGASSTSPRLEVISFNEQEIASFLSRAESQGGLLIVNATPLGMPPHQGESPLPASMRLPRRAFVYDLVYQPAETVLLRHARAQGLPACNGLGMLVEQAALAFERWTGETAPRQAMYAAVSFQADIRGS